jgi:membrane associated rhomboid family serine protease
MRSKPSWGLFLIWLVGYTILDMLLSTLLHGGVAWRELPGAVGGAVLGAALTWLFAYRRWLNS